MKIEESVFSYYVLTEQSALFLCRSYFAFLPRMKYSYFYYFIAKLTLSSSSHSSPINWSGCLRRPSFAHGSPTSICLGKLNNVRRSWGGRSRIGLLRAHHSRGSNIVRSVRADIEVRMVLLFYFYPSVFLSSNNYSVIVIV